MKLKIIFFQQNFSFFPADEILLKEKEKCVETKNFQKCFLIEVASQWNGEKIAWKIYLSSMLSCKSIFLKYKKNAFDT